MRHEHDVTERIKLEATDKRNITKYIYIWKKTDQKESGTWHKLKVHSINEELTTHDTIKKGHADTAGKTGSLLFIIVLQTYTINSLCHDLQQITT